MSGLFGSAPKPTPLDKTPLPTPATTVSPEAVASGANARLAGAAGGLNSTILSGDMTGTLGKPKTSGKTLIGS